MNEVKSPGVQIGSRVLRNTGAYLAAGLIPNVISLFILPLYTRYMDPEEYGLVALVTTFTVFVGTFMGLQLSNCVSRLYFDAESETRQKEFAATILFGAMGINLLIFAALHAAGPWFTPLLFPKAGLTYGRLMFPGVLAMVFQNLINCGNALLRVQERGRAFLSASLIHTAAAAAAGIYLVVFRGWGARGLLWAMAGSSALHFLCHLRLLRRSLLPRFRPHLLGRAVAYSLPIIPHSLGGMLFTVSDKYVANFFVSVSVIGLYEFGDKIAQVFKMMVISFHYSISPAFMRESARDRDQTRETFAPLITRWVSIVGFIYLGMALLSKELIILLFPEPYWSSHDFIPILGAAYMMKGFYGFVLDAILFEKKTKWVPVITLTAGVFNVVANLLLFPVFGMIAAAWTTFGSMVICFLLAHWISRKMYPLRFEWGSLGRITALILIFTVAGLNLPFEGVWVSLGVKVILLFLYALLIWNLNAGGLVDWIRELFPVRENS